MPRSWVKKRKSDGYYRMAKAKGYRSRAAYKLIQINKRFGIISKGDAVVDLGAAPGGWSQVSLELVGERGRVLAVDKKRMQEIDGVHLMRGDLTQDETIELATKKMGGKADVVISDMAPRLSGNKNVDHARSIDLAETALDFAVHTLRKGGNFVVKVFQGDMHGNFLAKTSNLFEFCQSFSPEASPSGSREMFVVAKRFRG